MTSNGKKQQVDLEELLGEATDKPVPPPPQAYYDFNKTNGLEAAATAWYPEGPTMTRQEFAAECDINVLMERYQNQDIGAIMRRSTEPVYVDFTTMPSDLMGAMQLMEDAENAFMTLPAQVRREFENDPIRFVDFAGNPENLDQMRSWGLAPPAPPSAVAPAEPPAVSPPAALPHSSST